jgi:hypothetical protein
MRQITLPNWLSRMDKDFKWLSIPKLPLLLVIIQIFGFVLVMGKPEFEQRLVLNPDMVLQGEIWRIFTFVAIPLSHNFLMFFVLWFFYFVMTSLESAWDSTLLTIYFLITWVSIVLASLLIGTSVDTFAYMEFSFFFALATLSPNRTIHLFFILPIAFKWIALFTAIVLFFMPLFLGSYSLKQVLFVSYLVFFGKDYWLRLKSELDRRKRSV